jgi:hypothetical protein
VFSQKSLSVAAHYALTLDTLGNMTQIITIVSKVPKGDNLVLRSADFYFSIVINLLQRAAAIFILERKEGEIGK